MWFHLSEEVVLPVELVEQFVRRLMKGFMKRKACKVRKQILMQHDIISYAKSCTFPPNDAILLLYTFSPFEEQYVFFHWFCKTSFRLL